MKERLVKVKLSGYLAKQFGKSFNFYVSKPAEAIKAMCMQVEGFEQALRDASSKGFKFAVFNGKENIGEKDFWFGVKDTLSIVPVLEGSKKGGLLQTIIGVALIVVGAFTGNAFLIQLGVGLALGGVVQMLTPQPKGLSDSSSVDNKPSYAFGGPVNTVAQGNPVAIFYGEREVGGAVISAGMYSQDLA